ncbi:Serine/arginine repetitive matrix protein 2 [Quillaja saponaria]|uniref:Serine/arginine repetitive matrix protein 2 n=2 Tax=Quillaja saponaria TaxID=32244 RepID=A0AAD7PTA9_QUISA|nr:Serine/arginine repetitive matrix protein 2 [Quillaja saponaria]
MYNGIGLQTPRGSGTNGYIQSNKFFVKAKTGKVAETTRGYEADQGTAGVTKKPNKDVLEHDRKRQVELKLVILEDKLIDQGYTDSEIAEKLQEARKTLEGAADSEGGGGPIPVSAADNKVSDTQTHQVAARKEKQMETLKAALGIGGSEVDEVNTEATDDGPRNDQMNGPNGDSNHHLKHEHVFLDRDFSWKKRDVEDKKVEKDDKKKGSRESRSHKKDENRKRRHRDDSSDTDSTMKDEKVRRKHRNDVSDDENDSDSFDRKLKSSKKQKTSKKHKKRRLDDSDDTDSVSDDNHAVRDRKRKELDNDADYHLSEHRTRKGKQHRGRSRHHDSKDESDTDSGKEKSRKLGKQKNQIHKEELAERIPKGDLFKDTDQVLKHRRRHDTDGEDSDASGDRRTSGKRKEVKNASYSPIDDSDSVSDHSDESGSGSDSSSSSGDDRYEAKKSRPMGRQEIGQDMNKGGQTGSKYGLEERRFRSGIDGNTEMKKEKNIVNVDDDVLDSLRKSYGDDRYKHRRDVMEESRYANQDTMRSKRKLDRNEDGEPGYKTRGENSDKEAANDGERKKHARTESESRTHQDKDDWERYDYSKSVKRERHGDGTIKGGGRVYSEDGGSRYVTGRHDRDYKDLEARRHSRDEDDHRGRKPRRDEEDAKKMRHENDEELHRGKKNQGGEEVERGNKDNDRDRRIDYSKRARYHDSRSTERKRYEGGKHNEERSRH